MLRLFFPLVFPVVTVCSSFYFSHVTKNDYCLFLILSDKLSLCLSHFQGFYFGRLKYFRHFSLNKTTFLALVIFAHLLIVHDT